MTFDELGLEPKLLEAVKEAGYASPTPIQAEAIPEAIKGRDVLGIAQTGTGKTAAFVLPIIHRLAKGRARARMPRSLVLAPTRELAAQVAEQFEKYGKNHKLNMALLIGGVSFAEQDMKLTRGVDVLIATPGRLLDHFERGKLLLTGLEVMVIDEADRMLDMGFIPDIERIFKMTPFTRQTLFFSATMPPEIQRITNQFLSAAVQVEVARQASTAATITQNIVRLPGSDDRLKRDVLRKLIKDATDLQNGIIFCNRKKNVDVVAKSLQKHGFNARPIHGDLAQSFRMETLQAFRDGELKLLVASDVAARGLDIPEVSHVFNYSVPVNAEDYVHRIGRTGRAGRKGATVMLVCPDDKKGYDAVLRTTGLDAIDEVDLGDYFTEWEKDGGAKGRAVRGEKSGRSGRGRRSRDDAAPAKAASESTPAPSVDDAATAAPAATDQAASAPAASEAKEQPRRSERGGRGGRRDRDDAPNKVVGFGDHVPAFLMKEAI